MRSVAVWELVDPREHPRLAKLLDELSTKLNTRSPTKIYLTPGVEAAVYEIGGAWAQLRGRSVRCMILGAGLLEILTMDELRSILAHEYGHFRNKDTAGGHLALSVRRTMMRTAELLAKQGATKMSPLWWFTQGYYKLFMRISQGASRLQEILADRVAARAYGSETFATALHVTVEQTHWFELAADRVVEATLAGKHAITNIYEQTRVLSADESEVQLASSKDFAREPSPYDSHPSALERVALANELNFASPKHRDTRLASEIFRDWQELQFVMTGYFLGDYLHRTGKNLSEAQVPLDARPDDPNETTQER